MIIRRGRPGHRGHRRWPAARDAQRSGTGDDFGPRGSSLL